MRAGATPLADAEAAYPPIASPPVPRLTAAATPGAGHGLGAVHPIRAGQAAVLRDRFVRAALAELPLEDARCLALHLIAGLDSGNVARVLGMAPFEVGGRIATGVCFFADRYQEALDALGALRALAGESGHTEERASVSAPRLAGPKVVPVVVEHAQPPVAPSPASIPATAQATGAPPASPAVGYVGATTRARPRGPTMPRAWHYPTHRATRYVPPAGPPRLIPVVPVVTPIWGAAVRPSTPDRHPFAVTYAGPAFGGPAPRRPPRMPAVTVPRARAMHPEAMRAEAALGQGAPASVPILSPGTGNPGVGIPRVPIRSPGSDTRPILER